MNSGLRPDQQTYRPVSGGGVDDAVCKCVNRTDQEPNVNGFTRVDTIGHPMSAARITQTFKRVNFGSIEHTFTLTDPKTHTSPWTVHDTWALEPETKLLEYACMENNRAFYEGRIKPFVPPDDVD